MENLEFEPGDRVLIIGVVSPRLARKFNGTTGTVKFINKYGILSVSHRRVSIQLWPHKVLKLPKTVTLVQIEALKAILC